VKHLPEPRRAGRGKHEPNFHTLSAQFERTVSSPRTRFPRGKHVAELRTTFTARLVHKWSIDRESLIHILGVRPDHTWWRRWDSNPRPPACKDARAGRWRT